MVLIPDSKSVMTAPPARADEDGRFVFPQVAPGAYTAYAWEGGDIEYANPAVMSASGFSSKRIEVTAKSEQALELVLSDR